MQLISHRGNINGRNIERENHPDYIEEAIQLGYDVEVDIWYLRSKLYLGHDEPQYEVDMKWLTKTAGKLWIHCKNLDAVSYFFNTNERNWTAFHFFWHQTDDITLTSNGYIWAYPGKQPIHNSIAVLPELHNDNIDMCMGICSDYIEKYK